MNREETAPAGIEMALLGLLRERPLHGYAIHQELRDPAALGHVWRIKHGRLYAILNRLAAEGYLRYELEPQAARPPRKLFHLTAQGREQFASWMAAPVTRGRDLRLEFLAKFYFAQRAGPDVAQRLLDSQRAECARWLNVAQEQAHAAERAGTYPRLIHAFRQGQIEAMLAWLDSCAESLPCAE